MSFIIPWSTGGGNTRSGRAQIKSREEKRDNRVDSLLFWIKMIRK